jgi:hypothetical protein
MGEPSAYRVDTDRVEAAASALRGAAAATGEGRTRLRDVGAAAPGWAADGGLPDAVERLLATLTWVAADAERQAAGLAERLCAAAVAYSAADASATGRSGGRGPRAEPGSGVTARPKRSAGQPL